MGNRDILQLPVFQVTGGGKQERKRFAGMLAQELATYSLRTALLSKNDPVSLYDLHLLLKTNDLILVTEESQLSAQQIVLDDAETGKYSGVASIFCSDGDIQKCLTELVLRLNVLAQKQATWACVLIGGKSSRMGQPKHLLKGDNGKTWLENSVDLLLPFVDGVVVAGKGDVPDSLSKTVRLPDVPGVGGPLAGILSACRWQPFVSWLLIACDMPLISQEAMSWLLDKRRAGDWGIVPVLGKGERFEPLYAYYDYRSGSLFEKQVFDGNLRISAIGAEDKVANPVVPQQLHHCWGNVNTPEQLKGTLKKDP